MIKKAVLPYTTHSDNIAKFHGSELPFPPTPSRIYKLMCNFAAYSCTLHAVYGSWCAPTGAAFAGAGAGLGGAAAALSAAAAAASSGDTMAMIFFGGTGSCLRSCRVNVRFYQVCSSNKFQAKDS